MEALEDAMRKGVLFDHLGHQNPPSVTLELVSLLQVIDVLEVVDELEDVVEDLRSGQNEVCLLEYGKAVVHQPYQCLIDTQALFMGFQGSAFELDELEELLLAFVPHEVEQVELLEDVELLEELPNEQVQFMHYLRQNYFLVHSPLHFEEGANDIHVVLLLSDHLLLDLSSEVQDLVGESAVLLHERPVLQDFPKQHDPSHQGKPD